MRSKKQNPLQYGALALVVLGLIALAGTSQAATETDYLDMESITQAQVQVVNRAGVEAIGHIQAARPKIKAQNLRGAASDVGKARQILLEARGISPAVNTKDKIADALGIIRKSKDPKALLPIYAQLDAYKDQEDIAAVRLSVDKAKSALAGGDPVKATDNLYIAISQIKYLEIDLPIHDALTRVDRALMLLHRGDGLGAAAALKDTLDQITVVQTVITREVGEIDDTRY